MKDAGSGFRPDIDGLRAIAVLLVLLFHARTPGFGAGFVGVDVFFVISGYLISRILLREMRENGSVDLGAFWARRVRRLLPACALMLLVTALTGWYLLS